MPWFHFISLDFVSCTQGVSFHWISISLSSCCWTLMEPRKCNPDDVNDGDWLALIWKKSAVHHMSDKGGCFSYSSNYLCAIGSHWCCHACAKSLPFFMFMMMGMFAIGLVLRLSPWVALCCLTLSLTRCMFGTRGGWTWSWYFFLYYSSKRVDTGTRTQNNNKQKETYKDQTVKEKPNKVV